MNELAPYESHRIILDFIVGKKSGTLIFQPHGRKLYFDNGSLIFANSENAEEHFSEILVEMGVLSSEEMTQIKVGLGRGESLGKFLKENGHATPTELAQSLKQQITRIVERVLRDGDARAEVQEDSVPARLPKLKIQTLALVIQSIIHLQSSDFFKDLPWKDGLVTDSNVEERGLELNIPEHYMELLTYIRDNQDITSEMVCRHLGWERPLADRTLYVMFRLGLVRFVPLADDQDVFAGMGGIGPDQLEDLEPLDETATLGPDEDLLADVLPQDSPFDEDEIGGEPLHFLDESKTGMLAPDLDELDETVNEQTTMKGQSTRNSEEDDTYTSAGAEGILAGPIQPSLFDDLSNAGEEKEWAPPMDDGEDLDEGPAVEDTPLLDDTDPTFTGLSSPEDLDTSPADEFNVDDLQQEEEAFPEDDSLDDLESDFDDETSFADLRAELGDIDELNEDQEEDLAHIPVSVPNLDDSFEKALADDDPVMDDNPFADLTAPDPSITFGTEDEEIRFADTVPGQKALTAAELAAEMNLRKEFDLDDPEYLNTRPGENQLSDFNEPFPQTIDPVLDTGGRSVVMPDPDEHDDFRLRSEPKSRLPLIIGVGMVLLLFTAGGYWFINKTQDQQIDNLIPSGPQTRSEPSEVMDPDINPDTVSTAENAPDESTGSEEPPQDETGEAVAEDQNQTVTENPVQKETIQSPAPDATLPEQARPLDNNPAPQPAQSATISSETSYSAEQVGSIVATNLTELQSQEKNYALAFMVACQIDTINEVLSRGPGEKVMVWPRKVGDRDCFMLTWGLYNSFKEASEHSADFPGILKSDEDEVWVVDLKRYR